MRTDSDVTNNVKQGFLEQLSSGGFCISKGDIIGLAWPLPELHVSVPIVLLF
jgi:hypothetical protein